MRRHDCAHGARHILDPTLFLAPFGDHGFHRLALQIFLRAAQIARDDGELLDLGVTRHIGLGAIRQRANDDVLAIVGHEFGRHGFDFRAVKQVE